MEPSPADDPEGEWIEPESFPNGGRRVGPAAVSEYLEASRAGWRHLASEPTAHRVGPEIVVVHRVHGILLDGTPRDAEVADVFRFREGRIGRMRAYEAPEEAFAAAPLRRWIDGYVDAWESNDPATIADLFTPDGSTRSSPGGS
jgi:ketosteroid isomerase-like protein